MSTKTKTVLDIHGPKGSRPAMISARGATKNYGKTRALRGVDLEVGQGEILGLVGHNGAGKSTLMRILAGQERPDEGVVVASIAPNNAKWDAEAAAAGGVRMIYQELALCPDLTISENASLSDPRSSGAWGWRKRAEDRVAQTLNTIFPGNRISALRRAGELAMADRQMVEIARALCTDNLNLLILDEPTESLGTAATVQLYSYLKQLAAQGTSVLLISHRMQEVITNCDRIAVMKDGVVVEVFDGDKATEEELLLSMGGEVAPDEDVLERLGHADEQKAESGRTVVSLRTGNKTIFEAHAGQIVGLAGLDGQGQQELLNKLWKGSSLTKNVIVPKRRAYVPGDRQTSGILPLWSVAENLTISAIRSVSTIGIVNNRRKRALADEWIRTLKVRGDASTPIVELSGGNQQKVLVARAFATDSELVLLDDPFRGVDVATKNELYALMKAEAAKGRCIVWYSTENAEMAHCDRVDVFRAGHIVSSLEGATNTEERIIADSFDESIGGNR